MNVRVAIAGLLLATVPWAFARAAGDHEIAQVRAAIDRFEYDDARRLLAQMEAEDPRVRLERARLALHEDRCDDSLSELIALGQSAHDEPTAPDAGTERAPTVGEERTDNPFEEAAYLFDVVRACSRVTASTVLVNDDARGVAVRFQDEHDRALFEPLADALDRHRRVLEADLGVKMPSPIRVLFVRDQLSLSITTGLPYAAATKTGTLGVAKWGRVTMVTPRATRGYEWLDTVAHELTHLAITRGTADRAPLWLQEGLAKREEQKWREPNARDAKISAESLTLYGIERGLDLPLDKLGPSLAMLPSAEQAMVVYAEVQSFVGYLVETGGAELLPKLLREIEVDGNVDKALERASGQSMAVWEKQFRAALAKQTRKPLPPLFDSGKNTQKMRELAERVRLAELLYGRGHFAQALAELTRAEEQGQNDPRFRYLRGKILEALQKAGSSASDEGAALAALGDPDVFWSSYGPYWALRAQLETTQLARDFAGIEALRADPLGKETACGLVGNEPLCEAAAPSKVPSLGQD